MAFRFSALTIVKVVPKAIFPRNAGITLLTLKPNTLTRNFKGVAKSLPNGAEYLHYVDDDGYNGGYGRRSISNDQRFPYLEEMYGTPYPAEDMLNQKGRPLFAAPGSMGRGDDEEITTTGCYLKDQEDALHLLMDMPGADKENVKVYLEGSSSTLVIKGVRHLDPELKDIDEACPKSYFQRINLTPINIFNIAKMTAEMKNGVLKLKVPKVMDEERKDCFHVQVD